jgi:DNA replication licensing factor MCM2
MPEFLASDPMDSEDVDPNVGLLQAMKNRTRRQYDEPPHEDEGIEDAGEIPLEQLGDIKANSIEEWIATPAVRKTIFTHFNSFIHSYVDSNNASIYGQRIVALGEGMFCLLSLFLYLTIA